MLNKIHFKNLDFNISKEIDIYNPSTSGFGVLELDGIGPVKASIGNVKGSFDGIKITSTYLEERNIVFELAYNENYNCIEAIRKEAYILFKTGSRIEMIFESDDVSRKIHGVIESHESKIFNDMSTSEVSIICENPYMTDESPSIYSFYSVEPMFEFEFSDDKSPSIVFSELNELKENIIPYAGDVETGFIMTLFIDGDSKNIKLYSSRDRRVMLIDNSILDPDFNMFKDNDKIIVNSVNKTVTCIRDGKKYNILNSVGKSPLWFSLYPGNNIFAFEALEGEDCITIECIYNSKYEGVI